MQTKVGVVSSIYLQYLLVYNCLFIFACIFKQLSSCMSMSLLFVVLLVHTCLLTQYFQDLCIKSLKFVVFTCLYLLTCLSNWAMHIKIGIVQFLLAYTSSAHTCQNHCCLQLLLVHTCLFTKFQYILVYDCLLIFDCIFKQLSSCRSTPLLYVVFTCSYLLTSQIFSRLVQ